MLLIIARRDAERDTLAAKPAANKAENKTQDPSQGALILMHVSMSCMSAELTSDRHWVVRPMVLRVGAVSGVLDDNYMLGGVVHWLTVVI